jgi:PAS domain S-box-containing protein
MAFSLSDFLLRNRGEIIDHWAGYLKENAGEQYARRPREELLGTVTEAFDANYHLLVENSYREINRFINKITKMRLEAGFRLSDVQKAFEFFRTFVVPMLEKEASLEDYTEVIVRINQCLYYTIHRFSDHFQAMHEKEILAHNRRLEAEVKARTADLRASEMKYKTLVEEINDGYFVVQNDVIVFANQAFCQMHGYDLREVMGSKFNRFVAPESRQAVMSIYNDGIGKKGKSGTIEYLRLTRNQMTYPTEILSKTTTYDYKLSNIGICRDITERVKMEAKIRESERMAYIGQITTSLSHEIRNPLSAVKMNLQILKKNPQIKGNDNRRIDISTREVNRLEGILKELLDFAKPLKLNRKIDQLNNILWTSIDLLEMKFREADMHIRTHLDQQLPELVVDREKMEQAFINVLLNALEASPAGKIIDLTSAYNAGNGGGNEKSVSVTIGDQGPGISEKNLSEIFKPFFTTKSKGTGLGLSNAHRILEAHGGHIEVHNRNPNGAYFKMVLPV